MKAKLFSLFLIFVASAGSLPAMLPGGPFAQPAPEIEEPDTEEPLPCAITNSSLRIGGSYSYVWLTPEGDSAFQGSLGGAQGIYEYRPKNRIYEAVKFSWRQGATHESSNHRFLLDFDVHERIGYTVANEERPWQYTVFTGVGYRYLGHTLKQPALSTLIFNYNEFYIPVGLLLDRQFSDLCRAGLNILWMPQVYPAVTIIPLNGANWIIQRTLANFLVELPITFQSRCEQFALEIKPFFEYWQDGKTTAVSQSGIPLSLPRNTYLFAGAEINLGWMF